MTNIEFVNKAIEIAMTYKTLYAKGMYGHVLTESNISSLSNDYPYWYIEKESVSGKTNGEHLKQYTGKGYFGFDCICLIKGILWGWSGDLDHYRGGSQYELNDVPDETEQAYIDSFCTDVTTDFSNLVPGEFLWKDGHCGIYIGNGLAVDSTNILPQDGVAVTAVANMGNKAGYTSRSWTKHGKLKYLTYISEATGNSQIQVDKSSYCSGEKINVKIGNLDSSYTEPWIGLYRCEIGSNFKGNSLGMWKNVTKNSSAVLTAMLVDLDKNISYALKDGDYKVVLFKDQGYTKGTEVRFQVKGAQICEAKYDEKWIDISIHGYLMEGAWVGVYPTGQTEFNANKKSLKWQYIPKQMLNQKSCQKNYFTTMRMPFSGGSDDYKIVLFSDSGYQKASEHKLNSVTIHTDILTDAISAATSGEKLKMISGGTFYCGENIDVSFYGVTSKDAWIGLYPYSANNSYSKCDTGMWCYTANGQQCPITGGDKNGKKQVSNGRIRLSLNTMDTNTGTLRYLKPGKYQVVLFNSGGYTPYAVSESITVLEPTLTAGTLSFVAGEYKFEYHGAPCYDSWIGIYDKYETDYENTASFAWARVKEQSFGTVTIKPNMLNLIMPSKYYKALLFVNSTDEGAGGETYRSVASCEFLGPWD